MELQGGASAKEADLNANGDPADKWPGIPGDLYGIVAFYAETVEPSATVHQLASQC
jgi:hypothetical protein